MAAPLRHALSALVWLAMAVIYLPMLPAAGLLLAPAFSPDDWQSLMSDPQLPQALAATLVSALIATPLLTTTSVMLVSIGLAGIGYRLQQTPELTPHSSHA